MEIYKILCKTTKKIYIGSTKIDKEYRWNSPYNGFNHLRCSKEGNDAALYQDIRKYGEDDFILSTLEFMDDKEFTVRELRDREDYYIKKFWDESNGHMMYNMIRGERSAKHLHTKEMYENNRNNHGGVLAMHTKESIKKSLETNRRNNGGILAVHTKESRDRQLASNKKNHGGILSFSTEEAIMTRSKKFVINNSILAVSIKGLFNALVELGYTLSLRQTRSLVDNINTNHKISKIYPELSLNNENCIFREINNEEYKKYLDVFI